MKQSSEGFKRVYFRASPHVLPLSLYIHSQTEKAAEPALGGEEEEHTQCFGAL